MRYFPDLSRHEYSKPLLPSSAELWDVGWLEGNRAYTKRTVDPDLTTKLLVLGKHPVNQYRGWHHCHFCREYPVNLTDADGAFCFGDGEIRVPGSEGKVDLAPNLIYHYVPAHE